MHSSGKLFEYNMYLFTHNAIPIKLDVYTVHKTMINLLMIFKC